MNSDEIHTGSSALETGWAYRAIYPTPEMLDALMQDLKSADQGFVPWFSHAVVHDPGLAAQLRLLFDMLLKPDNRLLKGSLLLSTLAWLITRHNKKGFRPAEITPAGQRLQHLSLIHISEPTRQAEISYAVFCLKKKKKNSKTLHRPSRKRFVLCTSTIPT